MKQNFICSDCGLRVALLQDCACHEDEIKIVQACDDADYQCAYRLDGRRCPFPGVISPYLYMNGPWYCREHWFNLHDPIMSESILNNTDIYYAQIMAAHHDWRETILAENPILIQS